MNLSGKRLIASTKAECYLRMAKEAADNAYSATLPYLDEISPKILQLNFMLETLLSDVYEQRKHETGRYEVEP